MMIRRAGIDDVDVITENRVQFGVDTANVKDPTLFRVSTRQYLEKHIESDDLIAYFAVEDGKIVAICMMSVYQTIPIPSCLNVKVVCC